MNNAGAEFRPRKLVRRFVIVVLVVAFGATVAILLTRARLLAAPEQPVAYSHKTHVESGIQCLYCHAQAARSSVAGVPSVERCMGCHEVIAAEDEAVQRVAQYWDRGQPIPWARVNRQPDFVYFSHRPHLGHGVSCESCHGDVGSMEETRPVLSMDMGWCLECHLAQEPEDVKRLVDCIACHK